MASKEEPQNISPELAAERLHDILHLHWRPAKDAGEATQMYSTEQFFGMLEEHAPMAIPKQCFRDALLSLGYKAVLVGDSLMWQVVVL